MSYECICRSFDDMETYAVHVLEFISNELRNAPTNDDALAVAEKAVSEFIKNKKENK